MFKKHIAAIKQGVTNIMDEVTNVQTIVSVLEEVYAEYQAMKASGELETLITAEKAVMAELAKPNIQSIVAKLKTLKL